MGGLLRGLTAILLVEVGRADEAVAMVREGQVDLASQIPLAAILAQHGRAKTAIVILSAACPQLEGDDAKSCEDLMQGMGG